MKEISVFLKKIAAFTGAGFLAQVIFLGAASSVSYASDLDISPKHESVTNILAGESVFTSCRQTNLVDTVCSVDCGNGQRFEKATGFCSYSRTGIFTLVVNRVEGRRTHFHTATVNVSGVPQASNTIPPKTNALTQSGEFSTATSARVLPGADGGAIANQLNNNVSQQLLFRGEETRLNADEFARQFGGGVEHGVSTNNAFMFTDANQVEVGDKNRQNDTNQDVLQNSFVTR